MTNITLHDKKDLIPWWLSKVLLILFLICMITYYILSHSPRIEDLFINLAATILGVIITIIFVEQIIKRYERKEWKEYEK